MKPPTDVAYPNCPGRKIISSRRHPGVMQRIAIFLLPVGLLGRERLLLAVARRALAEGHCVDVLTPSGAPWLRAALPAGCNLVDLSGWWMGREGAGLRPKGRTYAAIPSLVRYLRRETPDVLLAASIPPAIAALLARRLSGGRTKIVVRQSDPLRIAGDPRYDAILPRRRDRYIPALWKRADAVIAVSGEVATNIRRAAGLPEGIVHAVPNAVDLTALAAAAAEEPTHPWFGDGGPSPIVNVARLGPQKDQATLLRAFAAVRARRPARLVIFGQDMGSGPALRDLAGDLGIAGDVDFAGFEENPYSHMARASLFVLSSTREGMCNALIEALACGCPTVSTDCPCGSREVLGDGTYGPLVPVGDNVRLAWAMERTLDRPLPADTLRQRARTFDVDAAARAYLDVLTGVGECPADRGAAHAS